MQRLLNYKNYIIATSVLAPAGKPFVASFVIRRSAGADAEIIHSARLERTFAFGEEARLAALHAAEAYIDSLSD
jgi:hypothetical protein